MMVEWARAPAFGQMASAMREHAGSQGAQRVGVAPRPAPQKEASMIFHKRATVSRLLALASLCACQPSPAPDAAFAASAISTQTCDDQLQIQVVAAGKGPRAKYGDLAKVHYVAHVKGGAELARSHKRTAPYLLVGRKGELVEGLHRGLVGMQAGELRRILVPEPLGYRGRKVPGVPKGAVLEFWVQMFDFSPGTPVTPPATLCPSE